MPRMGEPGRYAPLTTWLQALPAEQNGAALSLEEIETIIRSALPTSAWLRAFWTTSDIAKQNWQRTGFTARLDRSSQQVTFTRAQP